MNWIEAYKKKLTSIEEAVSCIKSNDRVYVHPGCAVPVPLLDAMCARKDELENVELVHILTVGKAPYTEPEMEGHFRHNAFFVGGNVRKSIQEGKSDFIPIFLHEIAALFETGQMPLDVALIQVTPPDEHGFCCLGVGCDMTKPAIDAAKIVIAQVNTNMPRILGDNFVNLNKIHHLVEYDMPLRELPQVSDAETPAELEVFKKIGELIADMIEDESTLQLGIGSIPDSVLACLGHKKHLGIHSEMFSDGIIKLVEEGVITNEKKTLHRGKMVAAFLLSTKVLYDYVDNNPMVEFHPTHYVNDPYVIAQNKKMVAINSAIQVDLTGQVCADSIGTKIFSGFGGQLDFIRGAARSTGGKPIIALPSTAKNDTISRISTTLLPGAGVTTSRGDVHYVVTEYGVAYLHGKNIRQRSHELIRIAHPKFRDELTKFAKENKYI
jgi:4-hydroxybutyrate CoA-transferase